MTRKHRMSRRVRRKCCRYRSVCCSCYPHIVLESVLRCVSARFGLPCGARVRLSAASVSGSRCRHSRSSSPVRPLLMALFFFQAEDGIRDSSVTGVQTCALPILDPVALFMLCYLFHGVQTELAVNYATGSRAP